MAMEIDRIGHNRPIQKIEPLETSKQASQTSRSGSDRLSVSPQGVNFDQRVAKFKAWLQEHPAQSIEKLRTAQELLRSGGIDQPSRAHRAAESLLDNDPTAL